MRLGGTGGIREQRGMEVQGQKEMIEGKWASKSENTRNSDEQFLYSF